MPRKVKDRDLGDRTARQRLKASPKPYWRLLSSGHHLGYRRHHGAPPRGSWIARRYVGEGRYLETVLGTADDGIEANGADVLDFSQAQERARQWFGREVEEEKSPPYTVSQCVEDYLAWYKLHRKGFDRVGYSIAAYVVPGLGDHQVATLTTADLRRWHEAIAANGRRLRTKDGAAERSATLATDEERRKRKCTANRVLAILKAALNRAYHDGRAASDEAWRRVKPFRGVEEPRVEYLSRDEALRLTNASAPDFRQLVRAALLTGCRYGELVRMRARDYNPDSNSVRISESKSGRPRDVYLNAEGVTFFEQATAGRAGDALLFTRSSGEPWGRSHQVRPMAESCAAARLRRVGFHALRHTYGSTLAMQGVGMPVIARQLGHADTRITERHYSHLSSSYVADVVSRSLPAFGIVEPSNVARLRKPRRTATAQRRGSRSR